MFLFGTSVAIAVKIASIQCQRALKIHQTIVWCLLRGVAVTVSNFIFYCHYSSASSSLSLPPCFCVCASCCLPTFADSDQFVYRMLCRTSISKRYTYWLSLIKGSSNFYRFVCTSISFSFSITTTWTASLCLLFDARSMVQSQYKSSHVTNWWLCERMRHFWRTTNDAQCTRARVRVCMQ